MPRLIFTCPDGQWIVPDVLIESSPLLRDLQDSVQGTSDSPVLHESVDVCMFVLRGFTDTALPKTTLTQFSEARKLVRKLQLPEPARFRINGILLVMETVRLSGVANPYDASAVMVLSVDLETNHPTIYEKLDNQYEYETVYWSLVTRKKDPAHDVMDIIGEEEYAKLQECAAALRLRHR